MRTLLLAAATLPVAFAVADLSGVRPLGGLVLALLAVLTLASARAPAARGAGWVAVLGLAFALSHVIAGPLTTWGAIAAVTAAVTIAASVLLAPRRADRRRPRG